jgi:hypothetical protein
MPKDRCEITVHAIGPDAFGVHLTLEVDSPYDVAFIQRLKSLPRAHWAWDKAHTRWWVAGRHRETLCRWAVETYAAAYLLEGRVITNLRSGQRVEQPDLFDL